MQFLLIVILCIGSAICYGIIHDQISARVCVEYFTIGHPPVFNTDSPTLLAFGWGVLATWWVGVILGIPLAIAARAANRPKRTAASLVRPIAILLGVMAVCALLAGIVGFILARRHAVFLMEPLASAVPREKHVPFLADLWAHLAGYIVGFMDGIVLAGLTWRSRFHA